MLGDPVKTDLGAIHTEGFETTAGEIARNFGLWQDCALKGPVHVSHHGRPRVVMVSSVEYGRLCHTQSGLSVDNGACEELGSAALRPILANMSEGFIALDQELRITAANPAAEAYLGRPESQLVGRLLYGPEVEDRAAVIIERFRWVLRSGESASFESPSYLRSDRRVVVHAFPYKNGLGVLFNNVTQLWALNEERVGWQAERQALEGHPKVCLGMLNGLGFIVHANGALLGFLGFSQDQLTGVRLFDLATPSDRLALTAGLNDLLQGKSKVYAANVEFIARGQGRRTLEITISPRLRGGVCEGFCVVALPDACPG